MDAETAPPTTAASSPPPREGWQAEGSSSTRRWHFIRGATSLCGRFGFYRGELVEGGLKASTSAVDCSACKRAVDVELAKVAS